VTCSVSTAVEKSTPSYALQFLELLLHPVAKAMSQRQPKVMTNKRWNLAWRCNRSASKAETLLWAVAFLNLDGYGFGMTGRERR